MIGSHEHSHEHNDPLMTHSGDPIVRVEMEPPQVAALQHTHNFLGDDHGENEIRTWLVITICTISTVIEITCGVYFGSLALVADGIHMSTHAVAFFISAMAYSYSKAKSNDVRFALGTGKVGELAAYTSALILFGVSIYIIISSILRFITPEPIDFESALPVSFVGLIVNLLSGIFLSAKCGTRGIEFVDSHASHGHSHGHGGHEFDAIEVECSHDSHHPNHDHDHDHHAHHGHHEHRTSHKEGDEEHTPITQGHHGHGHDHDESFEIKLHAGICVLSIYEIGMPPVFRISFREWADPLPPVDSISVKTTRPDGSVQSFPFRYVDTQMFFQSVDDIPEPHSFDATLYIEEESHMVEFREQEDDDDHHDNVGDDNDGHHHDDVNEEVSSPGNKKKKAYEHDNNFRAALFHVVADAFVSILVIIAIAIAGNVPGAWFLDPLVAIIGSFVIISWVYSLFLSTLESLLDVTPDLDLNEKIKAALQSDGKSYVTDLHVWRIGPGGLMVVSTLYSKDASTDQNYFAAKLRKFKALKHLTIAVVH